MARAGGAHGPRRARSCRDPRRDADLRRAADAAASGRRACALGVDAGRPGRDRAARRASSSRIALHACLLLGAAAVPVDLRLAAAERERIAAGAAVVVDAPLPADGEPLGPALRHDLDATAIVVHTSGTTAAPKPVELTLRQLAVERARLRGRARQRPRGPLAVHAAARPRRRPLDPVRSAIYAHDRGRARALRHRPRARRAARAGDHARRASSRRRCARLLDAGLERPPALRCALIGGGPVPAGAARAGARRGRPGQPDLRPDRGVLAGHDAPAAAGTIRRTAPGRRCSARASDRRRRRDPRSRPDRRAVRHAARRPARDRRPRRARRRRAAAA